MAKNIDKWDYYINVIDEKTKKFIKDVVANSTINVIQKYYIVYESTGIIIEAVIKNITYNHVAHGAYLKYIGKSPKNIKIKEIEEYANSEIPFDINNILFIYRLTKDGHPFGTVNNRIKDFNKDNIYYNIKDAEAARNIILQRNVEYDNFKRIHNKDTKYKYEEHGYKYLGTQNSWNFDNIENEQPEYYNCINQKHPLIEVRNNNKGTYNTTSCPKCKIYWTCDSSD